MKKIFLIITSIALGVIVFSYALLDIDVQSILQSNEFNSILNVSNVEQNKDISSITDVDQPNIIIEGRVSDIDNAAKFVLYEGGQLVISDGLLDSRLHLVIDEYMDDVTSVLIGPDDGISQKVTLKPSMDSYFSFLYNVESIQFVNIDSSQTTSMYSMFGGISKLKSIDLGTQFDTSNVTNMRSMFSRLRGLETIDLGELFDTGQVTDMSSMFDSASSLEVLNLGDKFDTSNVTNMSNMFSYMSSINDINLGSKFNTENVTRMEAMFMNDPKIKSLDLGTQFDTSNVTTVAKMFMASTGIESLNLGDKFDTSKVTTMGYMFYGTENITHLDLGTKFDTRNVTTMVSMFSNMKKLVELDLGEKFNTQVVTDMGAMFHQMENLETLNLGDQFNTENVIYMNAMFNNTKNLDTLDLGDKFNTSNVTAMEFMFNGMESLKEVELGDLFDTIRVRDMTSIFSRTKSLKTLDLKDKFDTSEVAWMGNAFSLMDNVETIEFGNKINLNNVRIMTTLFNENYKMKSLDISNWILPKSANSNRFLEGTFLGKIILGPGVQTLEKSSLPNIIESNIYTGAWYQLENPEIRFESSDDLIRTYDGQDSKYDGTYVLERKSNSITYSSGKGNGAVPEGVDSIEVVQIYTVDFSVKPSLVGSRFIGWKDLNTEVVYLENILNKIEMYGEDIVLEAQYDANKVGVNFYFDSELLKRVETSYGTAIDITLLPDLSLNEYQTFDGWNTLEDGTGEWLDFTEALTEDVDAYAIYTNHKLEVTFKLKDVVLNQVFVDYGELLDYKEVPVVETAGYHFVQWNTKEDATGVNFDPEKDKVDGNLTLYAIQKVNTYQVIYLDESGRVLFQDDTDFLQIFNIREVPLKTGYKGMWLQTQQEFYGGEAILMKDHDLVFRLSYIKDHTSGGGNGNNNGNHNGGNKPNLPDTGIESKSMIYPIALILLGLITLLIKKELNKMEH